MADFICGAAKLPHLWLEAGPTGPEGLERQMSNSSYDGLGTNILTGAMIFGVFFLLVAVLANIGLSGATATPTVHASATASTVETVVVSVPRTAG